jgi:hypothetical protein
VIEGNSLVEDELGVLDIISEDSSGDRLSSVGSEESD